MRHFLAALVVLAPFAVGACSRPADVSVVNPHDRTQTVPQGSTTTFCKPGTVNCP